MPRIRRAAALAAAAFAVTVTWAVHNPPARAGTGGINDPSCVPTPVHPFPVVFLHGLGGNMNDDLNYLQMDVASKGYCTYSLTYGIYEYGPYIGGVGPVDQSAAEIKNFILQVRSETKAAKVDIVGHSEGGFQSLYVTKTQGISAYVDKVVAIAPPSHGTTFNGLYDLAVVTGQQSSSQQFMSGFGCVACSQLVVGGSGVTILDKGPIAQPGVSYTIIASKFDEMVTPTESAFVEEPGVVNEYVQDVCPYDPVGHLSEAYDTDVWNLVENALDPSRNPSFACSAGAPV